MEEDLPLLTNLIYDYICNTFHLSFSRESLTKEKIIDYFTNNPPCFNSYAVEESLNTLCEKQKIEINGIDKIFIPIEKNIKTEAIKNDQDKNRLELLPWHAVLEVGKIVTFGGKKYGDYNWLKGMKWSRLYGAALRHITSWINREDKDPETNLSHLAHAACCILFLLSYELLNIGEDDRWKR